MNDPTSIGYLILLLILLFFSAFFSASETAFISLSSFHLKKLLEKDKRARKLKFWFDNPNKVLITTLVGNNIVNISASVLAASFSYKFFHKLNVSIVTGIMTFLILIFAEIIPKTIAKRFSEKIAMAVILPVKFFTFLLAPITSLFILLSNGFTRIFGLKVESILPVLSEEDIKAMISAGEEEGIIEEEEREMIHSIFELGDRMVKEIMTPRVNIVAVEENISLKEIRRIIVKEGYSRLPVFKENIDKITGVVYIKDLLAKEERNSSDMGKLKARDIMRPPYFIPETKKVQDLIRELQREKIQMAIVVDEYGGTSGLVTMEDLLEEIVGEISDEYKKESEEIRTLSDGTYLVKGSLEIEKANDKLNLNIPEGKVETVAGFVLDFMGKFPKRGEKFIYGDYEFIIQESDTKKIQWVRLRKVEKDGGKGDNSGKK